MTSLQGTCTTPGHEDRPRPAHQWVCNGCVTHLERDLASVAALKVELEVTLTRQDALGGDGRGSAEVPLLFKQEASEARWLIGNTIGTWAGRLAGHLGLSTAPDRPARWLSLHVHELATHPEAGEAVDQIAYCVREATRVIDRPPELLFAGACPTEDCDCVLWAKPGDTRVQCRECDEVYEVDERREWMIEAAAVLRVTQTTALAWLRLLMDKEIPYRTWQSWRARGKLPEQGVNAAGQPLYLFGHARDLAVRWIAKGRAA